MITRLNDREFQLFRQYIDEQCGIELGADKAYLIESRLSRLLVENQLSSFEELYQHIYRHNDRQMAERVIDAITTNETLWFRDRGPWMVLEKQLLPRYVEMLRQGQRQCIRIWSAACSTGQEPYSIAMLIDRYLTSRHISDVSLDDFEILATDISGTVLQMAINARYDQISIMRGLDQSYLDQYFSRSGRTWTLDDRIRSSVKYRQFNLQDSFILFTGFELIFMRNVLIYFSDRLKKDIIAKVARSLMRGGCMITGSAEIVADYRDHFQQVDWEECIIYQVKE